MDQENIKNFKCDKEGHNAQKLFSICTYSYNDTQRHFQLSCSNCIKQDIIKNEKLIYHDFPDYIVSLKSDLLKQGKELTKPIEDPDPIEMQYLNFIKQLQFFIEQLRDHQKAIIAQLETYKEKRVLPLWEIVINNIYEKLSQAQYLQQQRQQLDDLSIYLKFKEDQIILNQEYIEVTPKQVIEQSKKLFYKIEKQFQIIGKNILDMNKILEVKQHSVSISTDDYNKFLELLNSEKKDQDAAIDNFENNFLTLFFSGIQNN